MPWDCWGILSLRARHSGTAEGQASYDCWGQLEGEGQMLWDCFGMLRLRDRHPGTAGIS